MTILSQEETKNGDIVLALDVMMQTPTVAFPPPSGWMEVKSRRKMNTGTGECTLHQALSKLSCQISEPLFYLANYRGTALNWSCWHKRCTSCSIFIHTCTWGMTNLNFTRRSPPIPFCSFLYFLFLFNPEQVCDCSCNVRGMKSWNLKPVFFLCF